MPLTLLATGLPASCSYHYPAPSRRWVRVGSPFPLRRVGHIRPGLESASLPEMRLWIGIARRYRTYWLPCRSCPEKRATLAPCTEASHAKAVFSTSYCRRSLAYRPSVRSASARSHSCLQLLRQRVPEVAVASGRSRGLARETRSPRSSRVKSRRPLPLQGAFVVLLPGGTRCGGRRPSGRAKAPATPARARGTPSSPAGSACGRRSPTAGTAGSARRR